MNVSSSLFSLGAYFDESMSTTEHVNHLVRSCFNQLSGIRFIRCSLTTTVATCHMNSFVIARVNYCSSILARLPKYQLSHIQSVLNVAARLVYGQACFEHITPTLRDRLYWLRVPQSRYQAMLTRIQGATWVSTSLHKKLLCRSLIKTVSQVIITPSPRHSSTF